MLSSRILARVALLKVDDMTKDHNMLVEQASKARRRAYAPYSKYQVGAAVLDSAGNIHVGCNVENASHPEGICAEANAIGSMVAAGGVEIRAIAVVGNADEAHPCTPCGGCRQRILEFATADTVVVLAGPNGTLIEHSIDDLLPGGFSLGTPSG